VEKLIDGATATELKAKFSAEMKNPVEVYIFINAILDPAAPQMEELNNFAKGMVKELHDIDPRIIAKETNFNSPVAKELGLSVSPSLAIGYDEGYRIAYSGTPLGHEASAFIETLVLVSRGESGLTPESVKNLSMIENKVKLQVFVTPDCPHCPRSVMTANRMAIEARGKITAVCVESVENQALANKFKVSSVPQQVINDDMASITVGVKSEKEFVMQALKYGAPAVYEKAVSEEKAAEQKALPETPEGVIKLTDGNFNEALKKYDNLIVDFWAVWCGPCKMLSPVIEELAGENKSKAVFGKLNVDENPGTAARYGIMSIPAVYYFKKGEKAGDTIGALPKKTLQETIDKFFK
jgi:thioredoxin